MDNRKLDAWLAGKVMGWEWNGKPLSVQDDGSISAIDGRDLTPFDPTTDPVALKALKAKVREDGWMLESVDYRTDINPMEFKGRCRRRGTTRSYEANTDTEELALCLAIARAYGWEEK